MSNLKTSENESTDDPTSYSHGKKSGRNTNPTQNHPLHSILPTLPSKQLPKTLPSRLHKKIKSLIFNDSTLLIPTFDEKPENFDASTLKKFISSYKIANSSLELRFKYLQKITNFLKENINFFQGFSPAFLLDLVKLGELSIHQAGTHVFYEDDICDSTYVVLSGVLKYEAINSIGVYGCGDTLSEEALVRSGESVRYRAGCYVGRGCCLLRYGKMGLDA